MEVVSGTGSPSASRDPADLLAHADALREARDWRAASEAYGAYLLAQPGDAAVRLRYGCCLEASGELVPAMQAYSEAASRHPGDAGIQEQIGRALMRLGHEDAALEAYARALALDPDNAAARDALIPQPGAAVATSEPAPKPGPVPERAPVATPVAPPRTGPARLVFDASDLLDYFRYNRAPTGIQRVQLNTIREALATATDGGIAVVGFDPAAGAWKPVPPPLFLMLAALSRGGTAVADPAWQAAVDAVRDAVRDGAPVAFATNCQLVNLGSSWWIPEYLRVVREAKVRHGIRYVPFVHDCIPLLVPEHCDANLVDEFARWFATVCMHADAVLTNSECSRADFSRLQRYLLPGLEIPCLPLPLDAADPPGTTVTPPPERPYVLFVGTIESRKNHRQAFEAWLELLRRHGPEAVPDLVCVGKRGWLADAALKLQANTPVLFGKIRLLHAVPDIALEALYRGCLFTLYNSVYEGWGLPVTESLAHGKVPLVPDHSALRESARHGGVFFDAQDETALVIALERLIFEPGFLAAREAAIAAGPGPRSWALLTADLHAALETASRSGLPPPRERLALRLGQIHPLRLLPGPVPSLAMAAADLMREGSGWFALEGWGVWTAPNDCRLQLPLEPGAATGPVWIYLDLLGPPRPLRLDIRAGRSGCASGSWCRIEAAPGERITCRLEVAAGIGREVEVTIEAERGVALPAGDGRVVGIGLRGIMACRSDDLSARLAWLEQAALPRLVTTESHVRPDGP